MTGRTLLLWMSLAMAGVTPAAAHGPQEHEANAFMEHGEQQAFGRAGKRGDVTRTVSVEMNDRFRFAPQTLRVKAGETVLLRFKNTGGQVHEWVLGTRKDIEEHAALMRRFPNMEHDEPHMVHVTAGQGRELVWQFNRPGSFVFACLLPGHFEAGMHGTVEVQ